MKRHLALLAVVGGVVGIAFLMIGSPGIRAAGHRAAPLDVVINEVAWSGTLDDSYDEWIELYNNTGADIDLVGWTLVAGDGTPSIALNGIIVAQGYYLLERTDDEAVWDIPADQIYSGALEDVGEELVLRDAGDNPIDSANGDGGGWPGGTGSSGTPPRASMERIWPGQAGSDENWGTNDGVIRNGLGKSGTPINGTPRARNSATPLPGADMSVEKQGPSNISAGARITYTIILSNSGDITAYAAWLTDVLPAQVEFVTHTAPYPFDHPEPDMLVWDLGTVLTTTAVTPLSFTLVGQVDEGGSGELTNAVTVTSATTESNPADNHDTVVTVVGSGQLTPVVLIEALYYDAYEYGHVDEAFRLMNISSVTASIGGWGVTDQDSSPATFAPGTVLAPGQAIWCTREATAFERQFGFKADYEYGDDTDQDVPDMGGGTPRFSDDDECILLDANGQALDVLVYGNGVPPAGGWDGESVQPWTSGSSFGAQGQILYRKRDQSTGLPVADTDMAVDWAQDPSDHTDGRKVLYPGWDLDAFFFPRRITETATLTVSVAPDNVFGAVASILAGAQESIQIEAYTFGSRELAEVLLERMGHGVSVTLLLEGAPSFTGISSQEKWIARQLYEAGAQVLFMINDSDADVHDRYENQHAKFIVVDGRIALIGSENLNYTGMPADDRGNGTAGRRGVYLMTDAPGVVARIQAVLEADADPIHHGDVVGCEHHFDMCEPPLGFEPEWTPDWTTYTVQFPAPLASKGLIAFEVVHSPENSLRTRDGLLGLLNRAGPGDTILVEQFYEHVHWGPSDGTPEADPNPRLEAYLDAARRGARVRILLDKHFDQGGENAATVAYLLEIALAEGLDLRARLADPTFMGLHNKMVLVQIGGRGYVHAGSINGSEVSSKANREMALQVQSDEAYDYLKAVFDYDWTHLSPFRFLPMVFSGFQAPRITDHLVVSEVYYGTIPEKEWVEIYNPTAKAVSLDDYKLGDAVHADDAEGMYRFPPGTNIAPYGLVVVAVTASGFREDFPDRQPDFEIVNSDPTVPDLWNYLAWGTWEWGLSNDGDEVLLLNGDDMVVDAVVYGDGSYPGVEPHPGGIDYGHSLERYPIWLDTDDCSVDFRDWPFPNPGELP